MTNAVLWRVQIVVLIIVVVVLVVQSNAGVMSVQTSTSKVSGRSSQQPTSPSTTVPANSTPASTTPASPPVTPVSSGTDLSKRTDERPQSNRVRENLLDLSAANKAIASKHRLHPKTRSSVVQAVDNWFGEVREQPVAGGSSRVMVLHGPPGCGKTCVSAELCRRYSGRKQLVAGHFFHWKAARIDHNRAVSVLLGLAHRMCQLVTGYAHFQLSFIHCILLLLVLLVFL